MSRVKILMVPAIVGVAMVMAPANLVWAKQDKILVCHVDQETGEFTLISVGPDAAPAHRAHLGDTFPTTQEDAEECDDSKVLICHNAGPAKMFTLLINADELQEHLDHLDTEGPCGG